MLAQSQFSTLLSGIYDAATDFSRWEEVLRSLASTLGGNGAVLGISGEGQRFSAYVAPLTEPAFLTSYNAYYHKVSPLMPRIKALPAGSVATDRMVLPRSEFETSEIYNDWILPQGLCNKLYTVLSSDPNQRIMIGVHRTREFHEDQIELCRLLAPHLQRAMAISLKMRLLEGERGGFAEILDHLDQAVILLDAEARPLFVNKAAETLFAPGRAFRLMSGQILALRAADTLRLHQLVASCGGEAIAKNAGGQVLLCGLDGGAPLPAVIIPTRMRICWLLPHQPVAMLFVRSSPQRSLPQPEELRARYGLTHAEAALAVEICAGDGLQAAANRRGVSLATARTHLAHIFQKTGVGRQAELVRLIMQVGEGGNLGPPKNGA
ncbi:MAG TPA: helix-turn-helix transcriptional regulator, partial [Geobacterales bacterium]|nr:helix-turn-helix transcriptional regulator [Geobacterales bacterium]